MLAAVPSRTHAGIRALSDASVQLLHVSCVRRAVDEASRHHRHAIPEFVSVLRRQRAKPTYCVRQQGCSKRCVASAASQAPHRGWDHCRVSNLNTGRWLLCLIANISSLLPLVRDFRRIAHWPCVRTDIHSFGGTCRMGGAIGRAATLTQVLVGWIPARTEDVSHDEVSPLIRVGHGLDDTVQGSTF